MQCHGVAMSTGSRSWELENCTSYIPLGSELRKKHSDIELKLQLSFFCF